MVKNTDFAVVDLETTGLFPNANDRIVEIAVLRINHTGKILDEYSSLVNPNRDIGATHIHGITARDVRNAPQFEEIAGDVMSILSETVFVAHNVNFDRRFVQAEISRLGHTFPDGPFLCTMQLARKADPLIPSRKLSELCSHFGININNSHAAYYDASATAKLFKICLSKLGNPAKLSLSEIGVIGRQIAITHWPKLPQSGRFYKRERAIQDYVEDSSFISRLVAKLPATETSDAIIDEYLSLLDRVLEDRRVEAREFEEMLSLSKELDMSSKQAIKAHYAYMRDLIHVALEDNVITEAERKDLDEVRKLLAISHDKYAEILTDVKCEKTQANNIYEKSIYKPEDIDGKSICFSGSLICRIDGERATRSIAQKIAAGHGMKVVNSVTKNLDFLIVADPYSMSGKTKKAREYNLRIISEPVFWRMMGIQVE